MALRQKNIIELQNLQLPNCKTQRMKMNSEKNENAPACEFNVSYKINEDVLDVNLSGRIDTVTAPNFAEMFETAKTQGNIKNIKIDAANLAYISSAGLRVLLMMKKSVGSGEVEIINANDVVKEIISQTGFDNIVSIK